MVEKEMSDEEAVLAIASAMKDNAPSMEEKNNVHTFLNNVVTAVDTSKIANLRDDTDINELGIPSHNVRGSFEMARISETIMDNELFKDWFKAEAEATLATSLSREGFLVRQATTQTKQVADITRRKKINKGWFGKKRTESSGGDTTQVSSNE